MRPVLEDLLERRIGGVDVVAHFHEWPDQRNGALIHRVDRLQFIETQQRSEFALVLHDRTDLHITQQKQLRQLVNIRSVQVDRVLGEFEQALGKNRKVHIAVVTQKFGHGFYPLFDHITQVVLRIIGGYSFFLSEYEQYAYRSDRHCDRPFHSNR